jgi:hypothetical protein
MITLTSSDSLVSVGILRDNIWLLRKAITAISSLVKIRTCLNETETFLSAATPFIANPVLNLKVCHPPCVESKIQCIKLCVYSHIHTVRTQKMNQIVSLYNKQHYVIYNYMFRPCKRTIIRLFTEPSSRLYNRTFIIWTYYISTEIIIRRHCCKPLICI